MLLQRLWKHVYNWNISIQSHITPANHSLYTYNYGENCQHCTNFTKCFFNDISIVVGSYSYVRGTTLLSPLYWLSIKIESMILLLV